MANGDDERVLRIVNFVHETPRHKCESVLEDLPCKQEAWHKRARAITISIKPKNVDRVLSVLAKEPLVVSIQFKTNGKHKPA